MQKNNPVYILIIVACLWVSNVNSQSIPEKNYSNQDFEKAQSLVHIGDMLDVDVIGSTEYDWRGRVTSQGVITGIDYIEEPIAALCRSTDEIAFDLVKGFSKVLRDPKVSVRIIDRSERPNAFIYGAIKIPQRFSIQRVVKLSEIIVLAGGFTENLSGEIEIIRPHGLGCRIKETGNDESEETQKISVKVSDILNGSKDSNLVILNGDLITVSESEPIYIIGGVSNPSTIRVRSGMTLTKAIAAVGGLVEDNAGEDVIIYRRDETKTLQIKINLNDIKSEKIADIVLQKFDIVEVNGKNKRKNDTPPAVSSIDATLRKNAALPLRIIN